MPLGAHLPTSKGFEAALTHARELGCDCLQIFSKSPRQWDAVPLDAAKTQAFRDAWRRSGFSPLVAHDSYLINLAAPDDFVRTRSIRAMTDEVLRADALGCDFLVTHCGAHLCKREKTKVQTKRDSLFSDSETETSPNKRVQVATRENQSNDDAFSNGAAFSEGEAAGLQRLVDSLGEVLLATPDARVRIALENTAGQGTCLGAPFEHLAFVLQELKSPRLCVCFDSCHAFAAGHDISTRDGLENTLRLFDATIGLEHLALIHFNDSKGDLGGHLDRHQHIGQGAIGREAMARLVNHPLLQHLPFILETPDVETMIEANLDAARALKAEDEMDATRT